MLVLQTAFHAVPRSSKKTKFQVPKTKAEKPVQTLDQPEEIEVDEVVIEAAEPTAKAETQVGSL